MSFHLLIIILKDIKSTSPCWSTTLACSRPTGLWNPHQRLGKTSSSADSISIFLGQMMWLSSVHTFLILQPRCPSGLGDVCWLGVIRRSSDSCNAGWQPPDANGLVTSDISGLAMTWFVVLYIYSIVQVFQFEGSCACIIGWWTCHIVETGISCIILYQ